MSVIEITEQEFEEKIKNSKNKVLVDCYADWCGPCQMLAPVIEDLAKNTEDCDFYKVNIDSAPEIAKRFQIMSIPTLLLFKDHELKEKSVGLISRDELEDFINK